MPLVIELVVARFVKVWVDEITNYEPKVSEGEEGNRHLGMHVCMGSSCCFIVA